MTNQAPSIAAGIREVFPNSRHRLCTWHLTENSKTNIGKFRVLKEFTDLFDYLLKYCETTAEFEHYWPRMMNKYNCNDNDWLNHLYSIKERWCPAYSKAYFSGGVLSSQRSETTNRSISHRLRKTNGLCDFYKTFLDVVAEWRSKESKQDFRFLRGNRHLAVANVSLLIHAREVYTISVYIVFEDQFAKAISCSQERKYENDETISYLVWRPNKDIIRHEIPEEYIVKRWTKTAMCSHVVDGDVVQENVISSSIWRAHMLRKFIQLVTSCQDHLEARVEIEYTFEMLREKVESVRGPIDFDEEEEVQEVENDAQPIQNPKVIRKKGERNDRPKSTIEKACNKAKGWKKKVDKYKDEVKATVQKVFQVLDDDGDPLTYSHPTTKDSSLNVLPKQMNGQSSMGNGRQPSKKNTNTSKPSSSSQFGYQAKKGSFHYENNKWYQYFDVGRNATNEGSEVGGSSNVSQYNEMLSMFDKTINV
ncbi:protein FAR1-RELATED SEQUENCE 7-like [Chenopodium quinoa]|uniref:protein FAR1-RELATED SEQUENCE 7-like n=1 Tax=Chenopodium quinoa TaxID=63459 RepID=UPI000B782DE5|nr:protein FAR1-RELATED SEQUENCE 7-like [Chenopodium quinoa]